MNWKGGNSTDCTMQSSSASNMCDLDPSVGLSLGFGFLPYQMRDLMVVLKMLMPLNCIEMAKMVNFMLFTFY